MYLRAHIPTSVDAVVCLRVSCSSVVCHMVHLMADWLKLHPAATSSFFLQLLMTAVWTKTRLTFFLYGWKFFQWVPTSSRSRTRHRRFALLSWDSFGGAGDPGFAALLRWDDERRGASGRGGRRRSIRGIRVVHVAVVLWGQTVVRLPAVALVLPLLGRQNAARFFDRVVVRLLDLRFHVVEVLQEWSGVRNKRLTCDYEDFTMTFNCLPVAGRWSSSCLPTPPLLCCLHPPCTPDRLMSEWRQI